MTPIDYSILSAASRYYAGKYKEIGDAPWFVGEEAISSTKPSFAPLLKLNSPEAADDYSCHPVASAEQSFIQLMLWDIMPVGRHFAITPCVRSEPIDSLCDTVRFCFMKLELINYTANVKPAENLLTEIVDDALYFFKDWGVDVFTEATDQGIDILHVKTGLELGSYGIRQWKDYNWVYGTGLAEPRFSIARNAGNE